MNVETLTDLFESELRRAYGVETELADVLATLESDVDVDALDSLDDDEFRERLRQLVVDHAEETAEQAARLEDVFEAFDRRPETRTTPALDGLVEEKERFNNVVLADAVRPLYYAGVAAQVERLEVTMYERLVWLAAQLDLDEEVRAPLEQNLEEERETLEELRTLAESDAAEKVADELVSVTEHA